MNDITCTIRIPGDHLLVGALGSQAQARRALGMLADELVEGLNQDTADMYTAGYIRGLAGRVKAKYTDAFQQVHEQLEFDEGDPRFKLARRDAMLAKRLAEILAPEDEDPEEGR